MSIPIFVKGEGPYSLREIKKIIEETEDKELESYLDCFFDYIGTTR